MLMSHRGSGPVAPAFRASRGLANGGRFRRRGLGGRFPRYIFGTVIAASLCLSVAQAATFGHSRIVSALGQPLHLESPVTQLTQQEIESLRAVPAPAEAWRAAGMTPPVALESMRLVLLDGYRPDVKVIQLRSDQIFDQPIVDVLLDVRSVSGQQRYQVSLLAHADPHAIQRAGAASARNPRVIDGRGAAALPGSHAAAGRQITVRSGDNMFAIARRNAVQGVTVYQMMMALQRSNPQAFIEDNVNLVKAGATLTMPDMDALTALSDREARRLFQQHAQAFARYRQRSAAADVAVVATAGAAVQGAVSEAAPAAAETETAVLPPGSGDRLRLSGGPESSAAASSAGNAGSASALADGSSQATAGDAGQQGANGGGGSSPGSAATVANAPKAFGQSGQAGASARAAQNGVHGDVAGTAQMQAQSDALSAHDAAARNGHGAVASSTNGTAANGASAGVQLPAADGPGVSLLASSGAIASDAVADKAPISVAGDAASGGSEVFGSDATSGGTVLEAGTVARHPRHPDDVTAAKKGVDESKKRILELEDNVRHLNEALQKQGHVAAEAALEGARSVSEAIKEVMSLVDPEDDDAPAAADPQTGSESGSGTSAAGADVAGNGAAGAGRSTPAPVPSTSGAASASSGSGTVSPGGFAQESPASQSKAPVRTEKKVSWMQENMLALIGGGLALIVAIVVWLLRRASVAKRDAFESDSPITDSMLHDRLRDIDLDLDAPPSGGAGPRA